MECNNFDQLSTNFEQMYINKTERNNIICTIIQSKQLSKEEKLCEIEEICKTDRSILKGKDTLGNSPLFLAICKNDADISQLLLKNGAELNSQDKKNISEVLESEEIYVSAEDVQKHLLLWMAVYNDNSDMVSFMAKSGYINENIIDQEGNSLLLTALCHGNGPILTTLMEHRCSLTRKDQTLLQNDFGRHGVRPFIDQVTHDSLLWLSMIVENEELVAYVLEKGADADNEDRKGTKPIILAHRLENEKITQLISKYSKDPCIAA